VLRSYIAVAVRHLLSQRLYSAINIGGLAIGLTCFILIALFVQHELSFDRQQTDADRIYRVSRDFFPGGESNLDLKLASIAPRVASLMREDFPEIERSARMFREDVALQRGDVTSSPRTYWVDNELFEIFELDWLRGEPATALAEPNTIVLTESVAQRFFGAADPIGETLTYGDQEPLRVTGVIRDLGDATHLRFDALGPLATIAASQPPEFLEIWGNNAFHTYLKLRPGADAARIAAESGAFFERHFQQGGSKFTGFSLTALTDIHLRSNREGEMAQPGSAATVYSFSAIALFVLLIACINFMNLATARSLQRAKEVGVRKAIGADRRQIVTQFLGESVIAVAIAAVLAVALVEVLLPAFRTFVAADLRFEYLHDPRVASALVALAVIVGLVAGSYPAFFLSAFDPARVLKGDVTRGRAAGVFRHVLVIMQFSISIGLLIATAVVYAQVRFANALEPGYTKEGVIVLTGSQRGGLGDQWQALKQELLAHPEVTEVTASMATPAGEAVTSATRLRVEGETAERVGAPIVPVDFRYFETYEIGVLEGRTFSEEFGTDRPVPPSDDNPRSAGTFVLSELAARELGWSPGEALGKQLEISTRNRFQQSVRGPVVGVVADVHAESLRSAIKPAIYTIPPADFFRRAVRNASIKVTGRDLAGTLAFIDATWAKFNPDQPLNRHFVDADFAAQYQAETREAQMLAMFSLLAIFVACLGLVGLASFTTERRTKEIGIRKVLGSSVLDVVVLLGSEFGKLVLAANLVAWPVAYFLMQRWLSGFAYRIDMPLWVYLASALAAFAIAWLTVGVIAARAASAKPLHALRYE
jgi:putative ABC transport system permease protein